LGENIFLLFWVKLC